MIWYVMRATIIVFFKFMGWEVLAFPFLPFIILHLQIFLLTSSFLILVWCIFFEYFQPTFHLLEVFLIFLILLNSIHLLRPQQPSLSQQNWGPTFKTFNKPHSIHYTLPCWSFLHLIDVCVAWWFYIKWMYTFSWESWHIALFALFR